MPLTTKNEEIELEAALAVVAWKHIFAKNLRREAARLAQMTDPVAVIDVDILLHALPRAADLTLSAIREKEDPNADCAQKVA